MRFYLRNLLGLVVTMLLVSLFTFGVFQLLPGNPALVMLGVDADPAQIAALEQELGVGLPLWERYSSWIGGLLRGDLGISYRYHQPVSALIGNAFGVTVGLAGLAMLLTLAIGLPAGILLAKQQNPCFRALFTGLSQLGLSVPSFCVGILLTAVFSVKLGWLPSLGYIPFAESPVGWLQTMLLPALSLSIGTSAVLMRYMQLSIGGQLRQDYVKTAYSKGLLPDAVLWRHVLRNSLIPVLTMLGMIGADVLGGSIIIENVFSLPGIGKLVATSITSRDLPLLQGLVLYLALIVAVCNFLVDFCYAIADPRIRIE